MNLRFAHWLIFSTSPPFLTLDLELTLSCRVVNEIRLLLKVGLLINKGRK